MIAHHVHSHHASHPQTHAIVATAPKLPCLTKDPLKPLSPTDQVRALDTNRDEGKLDPDFRSRFDRVLAEMKAAGYDIGMIEGYRSPQRQQELLDVTPEVTHAGACQSWHQFGLAADVAFRKDGAWVMDRRIGWVKEGYALYGQLAKTEGLRWGGAWSDFGHVELPKPGLRAGQLDLVPDKTMLASVVQTTTWPTTAVATTLTVPWFDTASPNACTEVLS